MKTLLTFILIGIVIAVYALTREANVYVDAKRYDFIIDSLKATAKVYEELYLDCNGKISTYNEDLKERGIVE